MQAVNRNMDVDPRKWGIFLLIGVMAGVLLAACNRGALETPVPTDQTNVLQGAVRPISSEDLEIVTGQTLYVPAYSEIFNADNTTTYDLTVMLSVRNTDFDAPIIIESIEYYDTDGNLVKEFVENPIELAPMATTDVVIDRLNDKGGTGANFIVVWGAEEPVHEPVVESLMTSTSQQQGLSFLSQARVLEETQ